MALRLEPSTPLPASTEGLIPERVDEIIAEEFAGKSVHGPVLMLAQHRVNRRLKAEGLCFGVLIEEVREDGTLYVQVKGY